MGGAETGNGSPEVCVCAGVRVSRERSGPADAAGALATRSAGGAPVIPGVQIADIGGGTLMAAVGILSALWAREETGRGQFVDIAMMDGSVAWQVVHVMRWLADRREPARGDTMLTGHHPCYAIYETRDGRHVTVGALEPHFWRTLCERIGLPEFVETQFAEGEKREEMFRRVRARFRERTMAEWVAEHARTTQLDLSFDDVMRPANA